jgi:hypothetical protein
VFEEIHDLERETRNCKFNGPIVLRSVCPASEGAASPVLYHAPMRNHACLLERFLTTRASMHGRRVLIEFFLFLFFP